MVAHIDMRDISEPTGDEVVAHNLDLACCVQNCGGNEEHQPIGVAELEGYELGIVVHREGNCGGLLRDEPCGIESGSGPASDAILVVLVVAVYLAGVARKEGRIMYLQAQRLEDGEYETGDSWKSGGHDTSTQ